MKVGRNDACPCGSGKKFKNCHLFMPQIQVTKPSTPINPEIFRAARESFERQRRQEEARVAAYGHIRPIINIPNFSGNCWVAVRGRLYYDKKWRFFTDFLFDYGMARLGPEWVEAQRNSAPADQHPLYIWRKQMHAYMATHEPQADGTFRGVPNGPMDAYKNFCYDLYTVDDNSLLNDDLIARLKHRDQFQGALHELFAEATCLRAGFGVTRENEKDRSRQHTEFVAVHKSTGQHLLVEAKSRHRAGVMGRPGVKTGQPDIRFQRLIDKAVAKDPNNPLAIFVDTNLPPERANQFYTPQSRDPLVPSLAMCALADRVKKVYGGLDPYNIIVFSNHPQHYSDDNTIAPGNHWAGFISQDTRVPVYHRQALIDLFTAVNLYGNVPTHFPPNPNAK